MAKQQTGFSKLSKAEQQRKWLEWQTQRFPQSPAGAAMERPSEPKEPKAPPKRNTPAEGPDPVFAPPVHAQYDAVLKRMEAARKAASQWHST